MKVVILAGGWGTRLGRYSELIPKPMVLIGNKPIIWHIMKIYSKYNFNEFIISCGVKSHVIKNFFRNYDSNNADFTINLSDNSIKYHQKHNEQDWKISVIDTGLNTLKVKEISKKISNNDIVIKVESCGICSSDLKFINQ